MSHLTRKFVAVLMLLWLPLFTGSVLAAAVSMQMPQSGCHEAAASQAVAHDDMEQHHHHPQEAPTQDEHSSSCSACGVCHLACTGYLSVASAAIVSLQTTSREVTPYLVAFSSVTSTPPLPPPLVRA
ncbi:MAG: DUF2946 domain-containing protein [Gallionellaceae bacterium]|nr:MAG: DUF2946 domain-containing protein [Gallionellaceae bacterium]